MYGTAFCWSLNAYQKTIGLKITQGNNSKLESDVERNYRISVIIRRATINIDFDNDHENKKVCWAASIIIDLYRYCMLQRLYIEVTPFVLLSR